MRFIRGGTLSQATRAYHKDRVAGTADPLGLVKLLGAFIGVCHAVGYAHSRGVIHRDLKGQNVVLGDFGEVIVLDWGLAKRIGTGTDAGRAGPDAPMAGGVSMNGASANGVPGVDGDETLPPGREPRSGSASRPRIESGAGPEGTMAGQLLGTPAYMAPEQAEGRQHDTDWRTDVYGLGAILYEILTGQPPFHAKTTKELLRKVRKETPLPPRHVNPQVAPALQAVCLKALSKAPGDRYASATELAQEVQRYLADEPVLAYPEPWTRRAARWARKHRTAVAAAAGLLVAATAALSVSTVLIARERNEARTQGEQARTAVDDMYTKVAENWLEDRLDPLQKEFLEKTLNYYEKFTGFAATTPAVRLEHGRAYQRMGEIHRKLGRFDDAERAFRKALGLLEPLGAGADSAPDARRALAATRTRLGDLLFRQERLDQAEGLFKQATAVLEPMAGEAAATAEDRGLLARALRSEAELLRRKGDLARRQARGGACRRPPGAGLQGRSRVPRGTQRPRPGARLRGQGLARPGRGGRLRARLPPGLRAARPPGRRLPHRAPLPRGPGTGLQWAGQARARDRPGGRVRGPLAADARRGRAAGPGFPRPPRVPAARGRRELQRGGHPRRAGPLRRGRADPQARYRAEHRAAREIPRRPGSPLRPGHLHL